MNAETMRPSVMQEVKIQMQHSFSISFPVFENSQVCFSKALAPSQWLRPYVVAAIKVKFTLKNIKIKEARRHSSIIRHSRGIHIPISRSAILRTIQAILIDLRYISEVLFRQKLELVLGEIIPRPRDFTPIGSRTLALVGFTDDSEAHV